MTLPTPCTYTPWMELNAAPNIMVDGAAKDGTLITLSHWPKSGTPENLKADSSTDIVFRYLDTETMHVPTTIVTGDHFDEDASMGIFALLDPQFAQEHKDVICDVAMAGDFSTFQDRRAMRIAATIAVLCDPAASPLDKGIFDKNYDDMCAELFREVLPRVKPIIEHTDAFEELWKTEDDFLTRSNEALTTGAIALREYPDVSLCVVSVAEDQRTDAENARDKLGALPFHRSSVYNNTECDRILTIMGNRYTFIYRYESWVQYISAPPMPRVDLGLFAGQLNEREMNDAFWSFDGVEQISPAMSLKDRSGSETDSSLPPDEMVDRLVEFLEGAEAAWDPYDRSGEAPGMLALPH